MTVFVPNVRRYANTVVDITFREILWQIWLNNSNMVWRYENSYGDIRKSLKLKIKQWNVVFEVLNYRS